MEDLATIQFAVQNLVGRYCDSVLRCDVDGFSACWTDDATWAIPGKKVITGRSAIVEAFADVRPMYVRCVQEILNARIDPPRGGGTTAAFQVRELQWRPDASASELIGVYHDEIVIDEGGRAWFERRDFELVYAGPVELPGRLRELR